MAKLYWRVKVNGKWSWKAATKDNSEIKLGNLKFFNLEYVDSKAEAVE